MKKFSLIMALGIIVSAFVVRQRTPKEEVICFIEDDIFDPGAKNFGAFPPDLPERIFDNFSL